MHGHTYKRYRGNKHRSSIEGTRNKSVMGAIPLPAGRVERVCHEVGLMTVVLDVGLHGFHVAPKLRRLRSAVVRACMLEHVANQEGEQASTQTAFVDESIQDVATGTQLSHIRLVDVTRRRRAIGNLVLNSRSRRFLFRFGRRLSLNPVFQ